MLIRIVKMTFKEECVQDFLELFDDSMEKIRNFEGCRHLELLKDYNVPNIFYTYSIWENEDRLDSYRNSDTFSDVWGRTKQLFSDKPIAISAKQFIEVNP